MSNEMRYSVAARNLVRASENKIHDDATARALGYAGGLVAGVDVYAILCHLPVACWERAWLETGEVNCQLLKPVYDGQMTSVTAELAGDELQMILDCEGVQCAKAVASLTPGPPLPELEAYQARPLPAERPAAGTTSLAEGTQLGTVQVTITRAAAEAYLDGIAEPLPLYRHEGLVHPGQILRLANSALKENVVLGPWIHTHSTVRNFSPGKVGETLFCRARVRSNTERKGHRFAGLDACVLAEDGRLVAHILHTAIYQPRGR